jgi:AraC family transcriptional regulator of arabinose operon
MKQNVDQSRSLYMLSQIIAHEGKVSADNTLGRPFFRHLPKGYHRWILMYTRDGEGLWEYPGWVHTTRRSEALLIRAGTPLFFRQPDDALFWDQMFAEFHPRTHWHAWLDWPVVTPGVMLLQVTDPARKRRIEELMHDCVWWANQPSPHWEDHALAALEHVLLEFDAINPNSVRHNLDPRLLKAMEFLSRHMRQPVMLDQVAQAAGLSIAALGVLFRRQLNTTPMRYLEEVRLTRATDLLRQTPLAIKEVAELVGFDNPFYFTRRFKARMKVNPRAFRRELATLS